MKTAPAKPIPLPSLKRLPLYYDYLKVHKAVLGDNVSTVQMAAGLNLKPIQVRKDLEFTGLVGRPKIGFGVNELISVLESFLGWNNTQVAFLVGVGNLGRALLSYTGFDQYGLNILAGFDVDEEVVGTEIGGKKIFPIDKLDNLVRRMQVRIGILTVPGVVAQEVADRLVQAGIAALWNFTPRKLELPSEIIVQNENFATSLAVLSQQLQLKLQENR